MQKLITALFLGLALVPATVLAATFPSGFTSSQVAGGLDSPTAMAFSPDGRLFVCEQTGRLRVIQNDVLLSTPFLTVSVNSDGERGLLGIAFDPNFATNNFIYIYYTAPSPVHNRVSRFTANGNVAVSGSEVQILNLNNLSSATNHNGGGLLFGQDGKLYISVGENANSSNSQTLSNMLGKVLRINTDGTIPTDNPFYNTATGSNRSIWAMGLRNPFTFGAQPGTSRILINDVGENSWEEINDGIAGSNYGWPATEGSTTNQSYRSPLYSYSHSDGCAITGGAFYNPSTVQFPASYVGKYFFADYCNGWIRFFNPSNSSVSSFGSGVSSPVGVQVSQSGSLYYLARNSGGTSGTVTKVQYTASQAPGITVHPSPVTVSAGQPATFSVSASGTAPLSYQWKRNNVNISGATLRDYTIAATQSSDSGALFSCVVSNSSGSATSNQARLTVTSNQAPTATITQPSAGTLYNAGNQISYAGTGNDPEQGTLGASAFTWRVDFHHDTHVHPFVAATSGSMSGSFVIPTTGETADNVWYRIHLTVTDNGGRTGSVYRDVLPRKSTDTISTVPAGLQINLDGQPHTTPYVFVGVVGIVRNIQAVTPQSLNGSTYTFTSWSDGGTSTHDISTPLANTNYKATFGTGTFPVNLQGTSLPEERTISVNISKPSGATAATVSLRVYDADFSDEGGLYINGNGPLQLFGSSAASGNDAIVVTIPMSVNPSWWNDGANTLRFVHSNTGGFRVDTLWVNFTTSGNPTVTVLAPNGGESWTTNSSRNVTWSSSNVTSVNVFYKTSPAGAWTSIAQNVSAAAGTYAWTVPNTPSTQARVKVVSAQSSAIVDSSNADFSIVSGGTSPFPVNLQGTSLPEERTISVNISKPSGATAATVSLRVYDADFSDEGGLYINANGPLQLFGSSAASGNDAIVVTIPMSVNPSWWNDGTNTLRFVHSNTGGFRVDTLWVNFTTSGNPTVTVLAPNGGESWTTNSSRNVTWSSSNVTSVNVFYKTSPAGAWTSIAQNVSAAAGTYAWTVPNAPSTQARVKVVSAQSSAIVDSSNADFSIVSGGTSPFPVNLQGTSLPEERTISVNVSKPSGATQATISMNVYDADQSSEGSLYINGNGPVQLFGSAGVYTNDAIVVAISMSSNPSWWNNGANSVRIVHTSTGGFRVDTLSVSFNGGGTAAFPVNLMGTMPEERTINVNVSKPSGAVQANVVMSVYDADFSDEGAVYINGNGPLQLFGSASASGNDAVVVTVSMPTNPSWWNDGANTVRITHTNTQGFRVDTLFANFAGGTPQGKVVAMVKNDGVHLEWSKLRDTRASGFEVFKSRDGLTDFRSITADMVRSVPAQERYVFTDPQRDAGTWYYEIRQVDADGAIHPSDRVEVIIPEGSGKETVPEMFSLEQNFPNPFNPGTSIGFSLPKQSRVKLEIYNLLGKRVAILVDELRDAGRYSEKFDAGGIASGIYFYRLQASPADGTGTGEFVATRKLIVVK